MPPESYPVYQRPQRVRLLYRELNPDESKGNRTPSRFVTSLISPLVLFQHWAVEVGERGDAYRFELQYKVGGSELVVTRPGDKSRASYKEFPFGHRHLWGGKTSKSLDKIHQIAQDYIDKRRIYLLGVSDCRGFALDLLYAIVDKWKRNPGLILNKAVDRLVLKPLLMPISAIVTPVLGKWGSIEDPNGVKTRFREQLKLIFLYYLIPGGKTIALYRLFAKSNLIQNTNHAYSVKWSDRATSSNASSTPPVSTPSQSGSQGGQSPPQAGGSNGSEAQWVRTSSNVPGQQWTWWDGTKYTGQYQ